MEAEPQTKKARLEPPSSQGKAAHEDKENKSASAVQGGLVDRFVITTALCEDDVKFNSTILATDGDGSVAPSEVQMPPWEQHSAVINMARFDYRAGAALLEGRAGFLLTCPFRREKSATNEALAILPQYIQSMGQSRGTEAAEAAGGANAPLSARRGAAAAGAQELVGEPSGTVTAGSGLGRGADSGEPAGLGGANQDASTSAAENLTAVVQQEQARGAGGLNGTGGLQISAYSGAAALGAVAVDAAGSAAVGSKAEAGGGSPASVEAGPAPVTGLAAAGGGRGAVEAGVESACTGRGRRGKKGGRGGGSVPGSVVDSGLTLVKLGSMGIVFLILPESFLHCPTEVVRKLLEDVQSGKQKPLEWCQRMLPVQATCPIHSDAIRASVARLLEAHLQRADDMPPSGTLKFGVTFKKRGPEDDVKTPSGATSTPGASRATDATSGATSEGQPEPGASAVTDEKVKEDEGAGQLAKGECIKVAAAAVEQVAAARGLTAAVDLTSPDVAVVVEILPLAQSESVCAVSVLPAALVEVKPRLLVKSLAKAGGRVRQKGLRRC
eukprot:jgi/Mesen1/7450/ME000389S06786